MRYRARWSNGCWKVFDSIKFADVAVRPTQRGAGEAAIEFNANEVKPHRPARKRW